MSAKAIREYHGKKLVSRNLGSFGSNPHYLEDRAVLITSEYLQKNNAHASFETLAHDYPWLLSTSLVVKPDQLIKRRGLIAINKTWAEVQEWIAERMNKEIKIESVSGILDHFIVEPFVPHEQTDEYYLCIQSHRSGEEILFYHEGGVDVGDVDSKALRLNIDIDAETSKEVIVSSLLIHVPEERKSIIGEFVFSLFLLYRSLNFVYLEINPIVVVGDRITPLDMAAKIDETASFINHSQWGDIDFPAPFGRPEFPEEAFVRDLDSKTGASLKLTILNHHGRVWTMVAGGGASVVYADTITDYGYGHELANYGEYSGAPSTEHTYEYARTILSLLTRVKDPKGKMLLIGGGIANFTDVAATFTGIVKALRQYADDLKEGNVKIWIRRAGPNYLEGLNIMRALGQELGLDFHIFGPETHITAIVPMALGLVPISDEFDSPKFSHPIKESQIVKDDEELKSPEKKSQTVESSSSSTTTEHTTTTSSSTTTQENKVSHSVVNLTTETQSIVYGLQNVAVQGMLDFDFMCKRKTPSVACMVFPYSGNHFVKFYWGTGEVLIPVYQTVKEAVNTHLKASILINFASFRSVYETVLETLEMSHQIKTIAIIAEGVPESQTRKIIKLAEQKGVGLIGPATVGGIKPGAFRIGNTGGMLDNILMAKLYRAGSVAYVSKSGGMSNELNNIISRNSNGVYEGVAIGGDRYPGSRFIDHLLRYQDNEEVKMMVLLGEVGGADEYEVCEAIRSKRITKPLIAWCIGTCASIFPYEVQFGHAGALARGQLETAAAKNQALKEAGAFVPLSFDKFPELINSVFTQLVKEGKIIVKAEPEPPKIPMDYTWAKSLGLVRKPANFVSSISDDRGDELKYAGMPLSEIFAENIGVGGVVSLLWFRRRLPEYATKFIEMILMTCADHGPAVSGAHNTIVAARAGKDLVSSLCSGLLTIGPRFGGALDDAAKMFVQASDSGISASDFIKKMKKDNQLIMGIGHRIKSLQNPDMRVVIIKEFAQKHFKSNAILNFALEVEQITTQKRANLILNVDGCISVCFVDLLRSCGAFTSTEADELISNGCLNGLFVLGRSIGFIGHFLDQNRLKQGLYRHPWDDISYL